ncbi:hypothetical protein BG011_002691 [Mortierella polycephala]|uniref:Uncharacterized protein n=1 Tax=Mortierella polycephala TaxID=41804 RepID=A0A9P6QHE7_9FUNG|nr:hypothetical protein BG011_002691 [Mortierella polycephala]
MPTEIMLTKCLVSKRPRAVEKAIAAAAAVLEMPSLITPQQSPPIKNRYAIASAMIPPTTQTTTTMISWPMDMEGRVETTSVPAPTLSTASTINTVVSESPFISGNGVNVLSGASSLHLTAIAGASPTVGGGSEMPEGYLKMDCLPKDKDVRIPDTPALDVLKKLDSSLQQPLATGAEETTVYAVHTIGPDDAKSESATPESVPSERVPLTEQQLRILSDPVTTRLLEAIQPWLSQNTRPATTAQALQSDSEPKAFGDQVALSGSVHEEDAEHPGMSKDGGSKVDMSADALSKPDQDTDVGLAGMSKDGNDNTDVSTNLDVSKNMNALEPTGDTADGMMEDGAMDRGSDADMSIDIPESTLSSIIYSQDAMSQASPDNDDRQATSISQSGDGGPRMTLTATGGVLSAGGEDGLGIKGETDSVKPLAKAPLEAKALDATVLDVAASSQDLPTDLFVTALLGSLVAAPTDVGDLPISDANVSEATSVRESDRPVVASMESVSTESKFRGSASPRDEPMEDAQILMEASPEQKPMEEPFDDTPTSMEDATTPSKNENSIDVLQAKVQNNVAVEPQGAEILSAESVSNRVVEPETETKPQTKPETEKKPEQKKTPESEPEMGDLAESISDVETEGPQTVPDVEASSFAGNAESHQESGPGNKGNAVRLRPRSLTTPSSPSYSSARSSSHREGPGPQPYASWHFVPGSDLAFLSEMQASNADLKRFRRESQWLEERVCRPKRDTTSDQILDKALGLTKTVRHPHPGRDVSAPSRPTKQDNLSDNKALATAVRLSADTRLAISMVKSQLQEDWEDQMRLEADQATLHRTLARTQIRIEETQRLEEQAEQQMKEMTAKQTERELELERVRNLERACLEMKEKQRIQAEKEIWQLETTLKQLQEQQGSTPTLTMTPTPAESAAIRDPGTT